MERTTAANPLVTLVNMSCNRPCNHCAYGRRSPMAFERIAELVSEVTAAGHPAHFYDMHVTRRSIDIYRLTRQFERPNPGWLNVNDDFDPSDEDIRYLETLQLALVMSLHGSRSDLHAMLAGDPNDFGRVVATMGRLRQTVRLPFGINYVVHAGNVDDLPTFLPWALEDLEVDFVEVINLGYGGTARVSLSPSLALEDHHRRTAHEYLRTARARWPDQVMLDAQWGPDDVGLASPACHIFAPPVPNRFCNAGLNHVALRTDTLAVYPCPTMVSEPALAIGRWREGRLELDVDFPKLSDPLGTPCSDCARRSRCQGGCRVIAFAESIRTTGRLDVHRGFTTCLIQG